MKRKAKPKDGLDILISEFIGDDPKRLAAMAKHRQNFEIAIDAAPKGTKLDFID